MYKIEMSVDSAEKLLAVIDSLSRCEFPLNVDVKHLPKKEPKWICVSHPFVEISEEFDEFLDDIFKKFSY